MRIDLTGVVEDGSARIVALPINTAVAIRLIRGETTTIVVTIYRPDGTAYPATGAVFTVKKSSGQLSLSVGQSLQVSGIVGPANVATFSITAAQLALMEPGRYVYDVWLVASPSPSYRVVGLSEFWIEPSVR